MNRNFIFQYDYYILEKGENQYKTLLKKSAGRFRFTLDYLPLKRQNDEKLNFDG